METLELVLKTVTENPDDKNAAAVAYDAGQDAGLKPLTARKRVNEARRAGRFTQAVELMAQDTKLRTRCREVAGGVNHTTPVVVIPGDTAPVSRGQAGHHTFKNGGICQWPGSARRKGYKTVYHHSTLEVIVGAEWVLKQV